MTTYLLAINVLLALRDSMHFHHERAHRWFSDVGHPSWATCPMTENGFVRIASHTKYPNRPGDAPVVLARLRQFCAAQGHQFGSDAESLRSAMPGDGLFTHNQVTDPYLVALAVKNGGKLATFDRSIPTSVFAGGTAALELLYP